MGIYRSLRAMALLGSAAIGLLCLTPPCAFAARDFSTDQPSPTTDGSTSAATTPAADDSDPTAGIEKPGSPVPQPLNGLLSIQSGEKDLAPEDILRIRKDALIEGAISFGARGGLAYRTFEIQRRLAENENHLSAIYNFNALLIPAQSGLLIEPPIVSEGQQAVIVAGGGQSAAVADRIYKIGRNARIVTAARDWRSYLERDWGEVKPPPDILLPKDDEEQKIWDEGVRKGWKEGVQQADEIFQADLDRLTNDFTGMVRYRRLLAQNMITAPYALFEDRGITGNSQQMRVGDRALTITGPSSLNPEGSQWTPTPQR